MHYVVGFAFDEHFERVVLIRKNRPAWQAGLLNGVGGKVEIINGRRERPEEAMVREFREEVDFPYPVLVSEDSWRRFARLQGSTFRVDVFCARLAQRLFSSIRGGRTDEKIEIHEVSAVPSETLNNLRWLIPMAINSFGKDKEFQFATVEYE